MSVRDEARLRFDVRVTPLGLEFRAYDFPGASVHPAGLVRWDAVREVNVSSAPPEVRTDAEVLFVPAREREALAAAANERGIAVARRYDLWGCLLEPFLDTEFTADDDARIRSLLNRHGIPDAEIDAIRRQFAGPMLDYNAFLWEWCRLGLLDLFFALREPFPGGQPACSDAEFAEIYRDAMRIALLAEVVPPTT